MHQTILKSDTFFPITNTVILIIHFKCSSCNEGLDKILYNSLSWVHMVLYCHQAYQPQTLQLL